MNRRLFLCVIALIICVFSCDTKQEKLKTKFTKVISSYVENNMDAFKIDSISIMGIDSLTDLDFAYFQKVIFKNYESEIYANPALYFDPITDEEFDEQEKLQSQLQMIQNNIQRCDSILLDNQTDTVSVQYFFVATRIFGKDDKGNSQIREIGFPIDKKFAIREINLFD